MSLYWLINKKVYKKAFKQVYFVSARDYSNIVIRNTFKKGTNVSKQEKIYIQGVSCPKRA